MSAQNLRVVFAQSWRFQGEFATFGKAQRKTRNIEFSEKTVANRSDGAALPQMRVVHCLLDSQRRCEWYSMFFQRLFDFLVAARIYPILDDPDYFVDMAGAPGYWLKRGSSIRSGLSIARHIAGHWRSSPPIISI